MDVLKGRKARLGRQPCLFRLACLVGWTCVLSISHDLRNGPGKLQKAATVVHEILVTRRALEGRPGALLASLASERVPRFLGVVCDGTDGGNGLGVMDCQRTSRGLLVAL